MRHDINLHTGLRHYTHSGLTIASEIELPEWSQCEQTSDHGTPDVVVRLESYDKADAARLAEAGLITAGDYQLHVPEVAYFEARDGIAIHVKPLPAVDPARVRRWLLGPVWGALCYQRDMFMVHASSVRVDGGAVMFCGRNGRGKSTLAAQLSDRGYALVGDDLCRLELRGPGQPVVHPSPPRMKLWSDSLDELGWNERELSPDHLRAGKFHLSLLSLQTPTEPLPVRAVYMLAWGELGMRELQGMNALRTFLSDATYRKRTLECMGRIGQHTRRSMEFLAKVPLSELTRPRDFRATAKTLDFLTKRWLNGAL